MEDGKKKTTKETYRMGDQLFQKKPSTINEGIKSHHKKPNTRRSTKVLIILKINKV